MKRVAVFLDAGYFWVQLCNIVLGSYKVRTEVNVDYEELRKLMLAEVQKQFGNDCHLLRVYWYDGPGASGKTPEHHAIDKLDDFKLRLGTRNGAGTQKGVDGLIIADLISLTQQRAITHALLMTGDSDITPGVIAAQGMGLRAHLLSLGSTAATSPYLAAEADLKRSWSTAEVTQFAKAVKTAVAKPQKAALKAVKAQPQANPAVPAAPQSNPKPAAAAPAATIVATSPSQTLGQVINGTAGAPALAAPVAASVQAPEPKPAVVEAVPAMLEAYAKAAFEQIRTEPNTTEFPVLPAGDVKMLPREIDIFLLTFARTAIGRLLVEAEKRTLREEFKKLL